MRQGTASGKGSKGKDGIIDDPQAVGGRPLLQGEPYLDSDLDGIPDSWETEHGLNPNNAEDGALITESGYSNLELYINSIPQDFTEMEPIADESFITALESIQASHSNGKIILRNGIFVIEKQGKTFSLSGQTID